MNRIIKFRAWDTVDKKWLREDCGSEDFPVLLVIGLHGLPVAIDKDSFKTNVGSNIITEINGWNRDHNVKITQFTGLYDKNNKEIYEGDIIKSHNKKLADEKSLLVVKYSEASFVLYNPNCCDNCKNGFGYICTLDEFEKLEVIGNIFENPE